MLRQFVFRLVGILLVTVAVWSTATDVSARGCCIEERSYYDTADSCQNGPEAVGVWQYGCAGQVISSWGVQTDHYYSYIWCGCLCGGECGGEFCEEDYEVGMYIGCNMEASNAR